MPAAIRPRRRSTGCATRSAPTIEFDAGARGPAPTMMSVDTPLPERLDAALRSRLGDGWLLGDDARRRHGEDSSKRWADGNSDGSGKRGAVRLYLGGRRTIKQKK